MGRINHETEIALVATLLWVVRSPGDCHLVPSVLYESVQELARRGLAVHTARGSAWPSYVESTPLGEQESNRLYEVWP
jgi:hypothetical protein